MDRDALTAMPEAGPVPGSGTATTVKAGSSFRALRSRPFRLYFGGAGGLGQRQLPAADGHRLARARAHGLTRRSWSGAVAGGIPSLLFGPWGGAVADRVDLRKLLVVTQTLYCLLAALLWALAAAGEASVPALVAIGVAGESSRSPTRLPVRPW